MKTIKKDRQKTEFGDFQTPDALAAQVVALLKSRNVEPASVVEPTCGIGAFVAAAMSGFGTVREILALEINAEYFATVDARLCGHKRRPCIDLRRADFFSFDWPAVIRNLPQPVLLLGNPPWVTSSGLGAIDGRNLPEKSNFQGYRGLDAITGKGNFDIAEWMLIKLLEAAAGSRATLAMLVKTSVARRVLAHAWRTEMPIESAELFHIDAATHFDVSASACLLVCSLGAAQTSRECRVFDLSGPLRQVGAIGFRNGGLVADIQAYDASQHLITEEKGTDFRWRSGVKHDCSSIMELRRLDDGQFVNGLGEAVRLESDFVYPMLKGSDVASGRIDTCRRWMIVPQKCTSDDTALIAQQAPRTWEYLIRHADALDGRGSSIYRNRPRFAVFGIGPYTFAPWKVAICGLYKKLDFAVVGPQELQPVVFDDTVYHLSFHSESEARRSAELLNSDAACQFFKAFAFWDAKRPITVDMLSKLSLPKLAQDLAVAVR